MSTALLFAALLSIEAPAATASPCLQVGNMQGLDVTLEGRLIVGEFAGPPNYEDVRRGDALERVNILELPRPICVENGGIERTRQVQLYSSNDPIGRRLRAARGHRIRIRGEGYGWQTGHDHRPLVVDVRELTVLRR